MVIFDKARALDQIRSVLAEMKKKRQQFTENDSKDKEKSQNVRHYISVTTYLFTSNSYHNNYYAYNCRKLIMIRREEIHIVAT